jgi:hypothetical protein
MPTRRRHSFHVVRRSRQVGGTELSRAVIPGRMLLEYLADVSFEGSSGVIRAFQFDQPSIWSLFHLIRELEQGRRSMLEIDRCEFVSPISDCRLTCVTSPGASRPSIEQVGRLPHFMWSLDRAGWRSVAVLIAPFLDPFRCSYQWMPNGSSDTQLVVSRMGTW